MSSNSLIREHLQHKKYASVLCDYIPGNPASYKGVVVFIDGRISRYNTGVFALDLVSAMNLANKQPKQPRVDRSIYSYIRETETEASV